MARPSKLTPAVQATVVDALRAGHYQEQAARLAGISPSTFYDWKDRGESGEQPYSEFLEAVEKARAEAEDLYLGIVRTAAENGTWQAAAWWLERSMPRKWGRRTGPHASGDARSDPLRVHRTEASAAEVAELLAELARRQNGDPPLDVLTNGSTEPAGDAR